MSDEKTAKRRVTLRDVAQAARCIAQNCVERDQWLRAYDR